ncbi:sigma-E processing peptidase SpoIIGA [Haloimpatiens sp. FM7330]|uniref:sigma-E processing peptidase SpoIIGA n=1 Tax=Haloimpatiens sp. FM7330 TaxID=3298610 RepID=UPI00362AF7BB
MIIYVDVVFIENFIINLFILYVTGQTIKIKVYVKKLVLASLVGSMYIVILLYSKSKILSYLCFKLFMAFIMIFIAFRQKDVVFNIKTTIIFIFYSMVLAGMCLFVQLQGKSVLNVINISIVNFTYKKLILSFMIIYIFIHRVIIHVKERVMLKKLIYDIEIVTDKCTPRLKAFLDTGNELREPVTNLPVVIVEKKEVPYEIEKDRRLYIPYKTINGACDKLEAFKPKFIKIYYKDGEKETKEVIIAFCKQKLSKYNDYQALLSRGIFE